MIKRLFIIFLIVFCGIKLSAQQYGNEWINFSQKHYRINIPKTGLYRIDSVTLANSGIPLSTVNPKNFQLFIKGEEQYIYIKGENDNVLNSNDYIEFYAEKNDCSFDSAVYHNINRLPNPYVALYNDTNYAYITWNTSLINRRVISETDINFTGYTPATYFYTEKVSAFKTYYSSGSSGIPSILADPRYTKGEGFGTLITQGQSSTSNTSLNVFPSASLPVYIKASYSGASDDNNTLSQYDHQIRVKCLDNTGTYNTLHDTLFTDYKQFLIEKQITSDKLQNSSVVTVESINNPTLTGQNLTNLHYIYFKYPQIPNLNNASEHTFYVDDDTFTSKKYLDITSVSTLSNSAIFYDLTNHKYISTVVSSSNVKVLLPNSGSQKKCFLTNASNVTYVASLAPVNQTGFFVNYAAAKPDSAYLIVYHKNLISSADAYKNHRQGITGGSHNVIMADIDELYDQFAYGNKKNPLAVRNFCKYLIDSLPTAPKYLLLLGKSIKHESARANATNWNDNYIPTMGWPSSDNLFTAGLKNTSPVSSIVPYIPTGRISAKINESATDYLNKVIEHETSLTQTDTLNWRKRVLHFAGGIDANQQNTFKNFLQQHANTITDTLYGGTVFNFYKTSTAPIQLPTGDSIKNMINYGASLINFFGHGSNVGFDQGIDDPTVYTNKGKYPFFIANSCYSGDIHLPQSISTSENFTMIKNKGSIAFLASSSSGIDFPLHDYTSELYRNLAYKMYYKGIGDAIKNTAYEKSFFTGNINQEITCLEMTLEGDPYIHLNAYRKPDYEIRNSNVSFNTLAYPDSIGINVRIRNLGKAIHDSLTVKIDRTFPNGNTIAFTKIIKAPFNETLLSFFISKDFENGIGLNHFRVTLDFLSAIDELSETNNSTNGSVDLFIPGGDVIPVYPYKYAIIPNASQITLKATTADPFAPSANYKIQLDTCDGFDTPLNSTVVTSVGGVIEWTVNLTRGDSTVYFWRITKDSVTTTDRINWRESSFEVYRDKNGWGQSHFHQFKNDGYQFVKYKRPFRRFDFENDVKSLECNNGIEGYVAFDQINYKINNSLEDYYSCAPGGWNFAIFDSISANAVENNNPQGVVGLAPGGNCKCTSYTLKSFAFGLNSACGQRINWLTEMEDFLNAIPPNQKILAWTINHHGSSNFPPNLQNEFMKFGAANITTVPDNVPYIIFGTKKSVIAPGTAHEVMGSDPQSIIQLKDTLKTRWNNGYIASEIIGPSGKWNSLHWSQMPVELPNQDSIVIKVIGIKANGVRDTLATFHRDSLDVYNLGSYVNAATYPYMQLLARMRDNIYITPPQLKKWQVFYDPAPECAINPKKGFIISNSNLQEGENLVVRLPIENIGTLPFTDSLIVTYWIEDKNRVLHYLPQKAKANPFIPNQVIIDTIRFNTYDNNPAATHVNYTGGNYLWVDVNPPANPRYQNEQYHFNNIARIPFNVSGDKVNPLLDVTFDGNHILNGDIISSKPYILVTLKDENKFLALNDTNDFKVFIRYPNQSTDKRLFFANNALQFTSAQLPSNSCKIEWRPEFAEDGKYKMIVQATDRASNVSGSTDYNIQFEIINKETVTEVLNYPNPFSTSTKFVFTLTGSEIPDVFIIQIMTITGKVVREITKNDLGNLHIGRNITSYAWDGKDDFGDKLANGVYLYRVITRHNGQAVEKRATDADSFFKKGIGKLVIMR